jgi:hypothetical protein
MCNRGFRCGAPAALFMPAPPGYAPDGSTLRVVIAPDVPRQVDEEDTNVRPVIFLDLDDVPAINREYTGYQVMATSNRVTSTVGPNSGPSYFFLRPALSSTHCTINSRLKTS